MTTERLQKIKSQVEFYFGDANYRRDAFLKDQALRNEGFVPIEMVASFSRLRDLDATVDDVKQAMSDSKVVELNDDGIKKIMTEEYLSYIKDKDPLNRSVCISGIDKNCTLDDIKEMLAPYMAPVLIRMRRDEAKKFIGSVFVELKCEEDVERVLKEKIPTSGPCSDEDEKPAKRLKGNEEYLTIKKMEKKDVPMKKKDRSVKKKKKNREAMEKEFVPRLFKYESKDDLDIGTIKKMVKNAKFVDKSRNVIRMEFIEEFTEKKFEQEGKEIVLTKMEEKEALEYCRDNINFAGVE